MWCRVCVWLVSSTSLSHQPSPTAGPTYIATHRLRHEVSSTSPPDFQRTSSWDSSVRPHCATTSSWSSSPRGSASRTGGSGSTFCPPRGRNLAQCMSVIWWCRVCLRTAFRGSATAGRHPTVVLGETRRETDHRRYSMGPNHGAPTFGAATDRVSLASRLHTRTNPSRWNQWGLCDRAEESMACDLCYRCAETPLRYIHTQDWSRNTHTQLSPYND